MRADAEVTGLPCPTCGGATRVIETRLHGAPADPAERYVRRRRECRACAHRFTTKEALAERAPGALAGTRITYRIVRPHRIVQRRRRTPREVSA